MAINYTIGQAFKVIADNTDKEAIADIARRFPMVAVTSAKLVGMRDVIEPMLDAIPSYVSARKVEKGLRSGGVVDDVDDVDENDDVDTDEVAEEKPAPKRRGRKPKAAPKPEPEPDTDEDDGSDSDEATSKYDGKNAKELFNECRKRGIEAKPKKPAKYYIDLLEKDDETADTSDAADDDEDWDI